MAKAKTDKPEKGEKVVKVPKVKATQYYEGIGRRKEAVARVRLYLTGREKVATVEGAKIKQGEIMVNKKAVAVIFNSDSHKIRIAQPFKVTNTEDRFAVSAHISGGGPNGQLEALILGIARALEKTDKETVRPALKAKGLLTRNAKVRQRRMVGTGGKARRQKQSPKR
ncbi:30S ribosomal protein S9 [Candidatus Microgenomates bacterium]|nr:30S ribosomal protein S9 [Candidatus Microgenomates bacterium]